MIRILTGSNNFALRAELHIRIERFVAEHGEMALEKLDGEEVSFERMQEALQSLPFLAEKKLVVLETPGANKQFAENVARLLDELPETTDLVIVEPKLDKRLAYYKLLKKQEGFQEFAELDERGLSNWLVETAGASSIKLSAADARYLIERTGPNQQVLAKELEKLSLYAERRGSAIDRNTIEALTPATPQSSIFQLLEAAFAGNLKRALELYAEQRVQKVEPQQLIAMLTWQLHVVALCKMAGTDRTPDQIAKDAKLSPYVVKKSAGIARGLTIARTKQLVSDLTTIDHRLKRESLDADDVLMEYIVELAQ